MIRVFKFGGALLKDAAGIERMASIVEEFKCEPLVVVVSAIGKTTNALEKLLAMAFEKDDNLASGYFKLKSLHVNLVRSLPISTLGKDELITEVEGLFRDLWDALNKEYPDRYFAYDQVVSFGETISSRIISSRLSEKKLIAKEVDASDIIATNDNYTDASVDWEKTETNVNKGVFPLLHSNKIVITQGFLGGDAKGNVTTLGREGSDFTAAIIGSILKADEIVIWKDVPGLMNADPKVFEEAVKLDNISYHEAIELAYYGASVIHPKTIQPLQKNKLALQIRSFYKPADAPSYISDDATLDDKIPKIILKENQTLLSISSRTMDFITEDSLHHIFKLFTKHKIHINLMQNSAISFSVCFNQNQKKQEFLIKDLSSFYYVKYNTGLTLLTLRHYDDKILKKYISGKKIFLEQKSRTTMQIIY